MTGERRRSRTGPVDLPTEVLPRLDDRPPVPEDTDTDADRARDAADDAAGHAGRSARLGRTLRRWMRTRAALLAVLAVVVLAFVRIGEQHWREGTSELGLALLLGSVLRAVCTERAAGLLAVRERRVDVVLYAAFGLVVLLVSLTITGGPLAGR